MKTEKTNTVVDTKKTSLTEFNGKSKTDWLAQANVQGQKSKVIRELSSAGMPRADIARFLDIRYQHVRNVLTQPLKKSE